MVQICIKPIRGENGIPEWSIIELQGDLESKGNNVLNGNFVGDLHYTTEGIPVLIIGHHILYGKIITLDKPMGVFIKRQIASETMESFSQNSNKNSQEVDANNLPKVEYSVQAVIKKKLIFKTRPKPIIASKGADGEVVFVCCHNHGFMTHLVD